MLFGPIPGFAPAITPAGDIDMAEFGLPQDSGYTGKDNGPETGQSTEPVSAAPEEDTAPNLPTEPGSPTPEEETVTEEETTPDLPPDTVSAAPDEETEPNLPDRAVNGEDNDVYIHVAAYPREADSLPQTLNVQNESGKIEPAAIIWGDMGSFFLAEAYDAVVLTGTVSGYSELKVTAIIEIIPRNIMYFIDAGAFAETGDNDSAAYDAVKAKLAEDDISLLNSEPDQFDNGKWGVNPDSYQFTAELVGLPLDRKTTSGYAGFVNGENHTGDARYIEYKLRLPVGEYMITTGHCDWWSAHGENPRAMNILFNDEYVHGPIEFGTLRDSAVVGNKHIQKESGILSIKVEAADNDDFKGGASLTFIGVEYLGKPGEDD